MPGLSGRCEAAANAWAASTGICSYIFSRVHRLDVKIRVENGSFQAKECKCHWRRKNEQDGRNQSQDIQRIFLRDLSYGTYFGFAVTH